MATIELKVPDIGESIQQVQIGRWLKREGDSVAADENVVELETDKAAVELPAPADGVLQEIRKREGETANVGEVVAVLSDSPRQPKQSNGKQDKHDEAAADAGKKSEPAAQNDSASAKAEPAGKEPFATPSGQRELLRHGLSPGDIQPAGKRIQAEDVRRYVEKSQQPAPSPSTEISVERTTALSRGSADEHEELVPMTMIRRRIAQRLVAAQQNAALLTTFNEADMSQVIALRRECGESFRERYGVKLGFMSFFVKAVVDALKQQPEVNAEVRGDNIAYRNFYHIGVAVGGGEGLVVPVLRHAQRLSFGEIEQAITDFGNRAKNRTLAPSELQGGTFTISNGGVYGSLLSTPIVNPPQSGILGMHAIQERPIALNGQVVIRPMMYLALTYDHRIVDGRGAVTFLKRIKESIEAPARMLIEA